jgi:hypothetical protein
MTFEPGKLYRLTGTKNYPNIGHKDGYLWTYVKNFGVSYVFKSLSTGDERYFLYPDKAFEGVEDAGEG